MKKKSDDGLSAPTLGDAMVESEVHSLVAYISEMSLELAAMARMANRRGIAELLESASRDAVASLRDEGRAEARREKVA